LTSQYFIDSYFFCFSILFQGTLNTFKFYHKRTCLFLFAKKGDFFLFQILKYSFWL
jgi:hypothetical protein